MSFNELIDSLPSVGAKWNYIAQNTVIIIGFIGSIVMVILNINKIMRKNGESNQSVSLVLCLYSLALFTMLGIWNYNINPIVGWENTHLTTYVDELVNITIGKENIEHVIINEVKDTVQVNLLDKSITFKDDVVIHYIDEQQEPYLTYKQLERDVIVEGRILLSTNDLLRPVLHIPKNVDIDWIEKE